MKNESLNLRHEITTDYRFRGLPITTVHGPLIEKYLEEIMRVFDAAKMEFDSTLVVPLTLDFPTDYQEINKSNNGIPIFFKEALAKKLKEVSLRYRHKGGKKKVHFHDITATEVSFHGSIVKMALFIDGSCIRKLGKLTSRKRNLAHCIQEAWYEVLETNAVTDPGLVKFGKTHHIVNPESEFDMDGSFAKLIEVPFKELSVLARYYSKLHYFDVPLFETGGFEDEVMVVAG